MSLQIPENDININLNIKTLKFSKYDDNKSNFYNTTIKRKYPKIPKKQLNIDLFSTPEMKKINN